MNKLDSTLLKLFKIAEKALKKENGPILLIQSSRMSKKENKKNKGDVSKANRPTEDIKKDKGICHHCDEEGHWKRNCKEYLATVKTKKLNEASTSGMYIIKNYLTTLHCSS
jgi:hypothetical protein